MTRPLLSFLIHNPVHYKESLKIALQLEDDFDINFLFMYEISNRVDNYDSAELYPRKVIQTVRRARQLNFKKVLSKLRRKSARNERFFRARLRRMTAVNVHLIPIALLYFFLKYSIHLPLKRVLKSIFFLLRRSRRLRPHSNFLSYLIYVLVISQNFRSYLKTRKVSMLVLNEANTEYFSELFIKTARKNGIRTLVIPYTFCTPAEPAESYFNSKDHQLSPGIWSHLFETLLPGWVYLYKGRKMLRLNFGQILVQELLAISAPQPWVQESCTADAIAASSTYDRDYLINIGIPATQIEVTGIPNQDLLFSWKAKCQETRHSINQTFNWDSERALAVFAVPPDATYIGSENTRREFNTYMEILEYWSQTFKRQTTFNVVLCPHPTIDIKELAFMESPHVRLSSLPSSQLIPSADLFVASISTTIKWAISCGVPVINYDVYRLGYDDFKAADGVIHCETKAQYEHYLNKLCSDPEYLAHLKTIQNGISSHWGTLDGKATERIKNLLKTLITSIKN